MLSKVTKIPSRTKKSSIWNFKRKNPELHLKSNKSKDYLTFSISGFNSVRIQIQQDFSIFEDEMNKTMESKLILNITNEILTNFNLDIRIANDQFLVRFYSIFRYLKFHAITAIFRRLKICLQLTSRAVDPRARARTTQVCHRV